MTDDTSVVAATAVPLFFKKSRRDGGVWLADVEMGCVIGKELRGGVKEKT